MADEANSLNTGSDSSDILSQLLHTSSDNQTKILESIDKSLKDILKNSRGLSSIDALNRVYSNRSAPFRTNTFADWFSQFGNKRRGKSNTSSGSFLDGFEKSIYEGFLGSDFKDKLEGIFNQLAVNMGVSLQDIPNELGKAAGNKVLTAIKGTKVDDFVNKELSSIKDKILGGLSESLNSKQTPSTTSQSEYKDVTQNTSSTQSANSNTSPIDRMSQYDVEVLTINAQSVTVNQLKKPIADSQLEALNDTEYVQNAVNTIIPSPENIITDSVTDNLKDIIDITSNSKSAALKASESMTTATLSTGELAGSVMGADAALSGLTKVGLSLTPELLVLVGAVSLVSEVLNLFGPAIEGAGKLIKSISEVSQRYEKSRQKQIKEGRDRLYADVKTMVETPFQILEDAATKWYDVWNNNLRTINATQGYTKADLQDLMSVYADRLRDSGLSSVVSAADITNNLATVLNSGLSGKVAEEFAFLATELNAMVPTQDFFTYSDTYASIAANQIRLGQSEADAIEYANKQIKQFANNILYANRELSGGFSSGLKNAETLFSQSVQIAQSAKTNNISEISGVMAAVSAITGAIAPDLASAMTDTIYKAATGGNSSEIVALRSLAGINASNTEFLRALASNPKKIFSNLFQTLADRQNMSPDAYMEVAEGLSGIFGVSMDAFARVDFNYLAKAISEMDTSSKALAENLLLLASGETTTSAEQMRMQEINKYMIDEGLALVLDNEAAQAIQNHMWDEQIARELMEAEYGVELQGTALEFLESLAETVDNILGFLNPLSIIGDIIDFGESVIESRMEDADIAQLLNAGKVGAGSVTSMYQLTNRDVDLNVTSDLLSKFGVQSFYGQVASNRDIINRFNHPISTIKVSSNNDITALNGQPDEINSSILRLQGVESKYSWNTVGKSLADAINSSSFSNVSYTGNTVETLSATQKAQALSNNRLVEALNSMNEFVANDAEHKYNYNDWENSVKEQYKISDFDAVLRDAGLTKEFVKGKFSNLETQVAAQAKLDRENQEADFWQTSTDLASETQNVLREIDNSINLHGNNINELLTDTNIYLLDISSIVSSFESNTYTQLNETDELLKSINSYSSHLYKKFDTFQKSWNEYFIEHKVYNNSFTHETYDKIARKEKESSETAIYALAEALTQNDVKLLLDPTVQTNALLAQILKVVSALLTQTSSGSNQVALPSTLTKLLLNNSNI